jgi:uncharacterized damage-inducible protein DinB
MHTPASLLDLHERTHRCLTVLLVHCRGFTDGDLHRELPGFGYPTIQLQLHHVIGAQRYWIGVLQGRIEADEDAPDFPTIETLERFRGQVFAATEAYLRGATAAELAAVRTSEPSNQRKCVAKSPLGPISGTAISRNASDVSRSTTEQVP